MEIAAAISDDPGMMQVRSWWTGLAVAVAAAACGNVAGSPDALSSAIDAPVVVVDAPTGAPDAALPRCNPATAFGTPVPLTTINTDASDEFLRLSPDELTGYFSSTRPGGLGGFDIYQTTRATRDTMFADVTAVPGVNSAENERRPTVTSDGLELYVTRLSSANNDDLYQARRSNTQSSFGPLAALSAVNSPQNDGAPYVLPDGSAMFFNSDRDGNEDIYRAPRAGTGYGAASRVSGVDLASSASDGTVVMSTNELVVYLGSNRPGGVGDYDIYRASRASTADGFGALVNLSEVNTTALEGPSWVSADDCVLYLTRQVPGPNGNHYDLYVSTRGL